MVVKSLTIHFSDQDEVKEMLVWLEDLIQSELTIAPAPVSPRKWFAIKVREAIQRELSRK